MDSDDPFYFNLLKCEATKDLIDLFDLEDGSHYFTKRHLNGTEFYRIILDTPETQMLHECIKDLNIYIPRLNMYMEDYLFLKIQPPAPVYKLINQFNIEQIFDPYLHNAKLYRLRKKYFNY